MEEGDMAASEVDRPARIEGLTEDRIVELDVREDLRQGREPFARIMAARGQVPDGGALMLRAIFEPAPLYAVLGKQGWSHWTDQRGEEDWVVWFYREDGPAGAGAPELVADAGAGGHGDPEGAVVLDVRGMEPPEPMVRTLTALESLPRGETLVQINVREPRFLLPQLEERGFVYEVREQSEDLVRVFIRHAEE
jgi:uncharacterized protein (DUF2249 family)